MTGPVHAGTDLAQYRWRNRVLLVFAPAATTPALVAQTDAVAVARGGFDERDLVVIEVVAGSEPGIRRRFGVAPGAFAVILLGKDGGEKRRDGHPVTPAQLFGEIDQMPMRKAEVGRL